MERTIRNLLFLLLISIFTACAPPPAASHNASSDLSGQIEGMIFSAKFAQARSLPSGRGIAIDFADYEVRCSDFLTNATDGNRFISIVFNGFSGPGNYTIGANPASYDTFASVTTWQEDPLTGNLTTYGLILNSGTVAISAADVAEINGNVSNLTAALATDIAGAFTANYCTEQ